MQIFGWYTSRRDIYASTNAVKFFHVAVAVSSRFGSSNKRVKQKKCENVPQLNHCCVR